MTETRLTIDIIGHARRAAATAFAHEVADALKDRPQHEHYFVLLEKAQLFLEQYESGLENLARNWQKAAEDAAAISLMPPIIRGV